MPTKSKKVNDGDCRVVVSHPKAGTQMASLEDSFNHVVCPPSAGLQQAATELYAAIGAALKSARDVSERNGQYESHVEAWLLLRLVIRNCEAICVLARRDMVLFPAAVVAARAAFEQALRSRWLLQPSALAEREARCLCHLKSEEMHIARVSEWFPGTSDLGTERLLKIREFREGIARRLPAGTVIPKAVPNIRDMLAEIGESAVYPAYAHMSQFAHGTHLATWLNRRNLGTLRQQGEFVGESEWRVAMAVASLALRLAVASVLRDDSADGGTLVQS